MKFLKVVFCAFGLAVAGLALADSTTATSTSEKKENKEIKENKTEVKENRTINRNINRTNTENININANMGPESVHKETKYFCSPQEQAAKASCDKWLADQKASLRSRLLTSSCSNPRFLYGKEEHDCMAYLSEGEVSFLLNQK
jgi:hypothetical protein